MGRIVVVVVVVVEVVVMVVFEETTSSNPRGTTRFRRCTVPSSSCWKTGKYRCNITCGLSGRVMYLLSSLISYLIGSDRIGSDRIGSDLMIVCVLSDLI